MPKRPIFALQDLDYKFGLQIVSGEITWENIVEDNTFATSTQCTNLHSICMQALRNKAWYISPPIWYILSEAFLKYVELKPVQLSLPPSKNRKQMKMDNGAELYLPALRLNNVSCIESTLWIN